ncbi:CDP-glycerol glycerophosphotransferase family protein [Pseudoalteromonas sp. MB47]|uniref:CDP-glycerol glycerophosphotransferase family protein n=1 Tax=Pseudoalteromonas sp. MB47 TaxID=2588452 RepID=UPI0014099C9B|nr:CDP-glycerol glycerophosphotransferase family protein [Pseudoalteromonas sp. MB47]NHH91308.1 hypothetical protein [Pseudoalteromonas sp. MB47]
MKNLIYIVGAGSFAEKLAISLKKFPLQVVGFIDEFRTEDLMELPVTKASELVFDPSALFITAISNQVYTKNAIERLVNVSVARSNIIPLYYDSCCVYLESTLQKNFTENIKKLTQCNGQFSQYELQTRVSTLNNNSISIRLLSRGSLFLSHLNPIRKILDINSINYELVTDREYPKLGKHKIASQEGMLSAESELVITTQFFNVAPATTKRLTLLHAIYDSMMFRESIFDEIDSPKHHFIAIPTEACMTFFKEKLSNRKLRNKVTLLPFGYPKLDQNIKSFKEYKLISAEEKLIIYAPTQSLTPNFEASEGFSLLDAQEYLMRILEILPSHQLILQPHPDDLVLLKEGSNSDEKTALKKLIKLAGSHPRVSLVDPNISQIELFSKSQFLISDTSSTAYTYAFTTSKPVLFLSPQEKELKEKWAHLSYVKDRDKVGVICASLNDLDSAISTLLLNSEDIINQIEQLKHLQVFNLSNSKACVIKTINSIKQNNIPNNWVTF